MTIQRCFACGKRLRCRSELVYCSDEQAPVVGPDCWQHIWDAGDKGYQPPMGGPRLWAKKEWARPREAVAHA